MPQEFLPHFSDAEEGYISDILSYRIVDGTVYYFHCALPIFTHAEKDQSSFRMITSQFVVLGLCKQVAIIRAFGVTPISVKRSVKKYRESGVQAFFEEPPTRGSSVLTKTVLTQAQELLNQGLTKLEVAKQIDVKRDTLNKAILSGRLVEPVKKTLLKDGAKANEA